MRSDPQDRMRLIDRPEAVLFSMREHDIIQTVFEQVTQQLQGGFSTRVAAVNFARGEVFELDEPSIRAAWQKFSTGTLLERAEIKFRLIRADVQCMACFQKYRPEARRIHCPHCGSFGAKILTGEEFSLDSIETERE